MENAFFGFFERGTMETPADSLEWDYGKKRCEKTTEKGLCLTLKHHGATNSYARNQGETGRRYEY